MVIALSRKITICGQSVIATHHVCETGGDVRHLVQDDFKMRLDILLEVEFEPRYNENNNQ